MKNSVITWPAPAGEPSSPDYTLEVNGMPVFVYPARVRSEILRQKGLWTHRPNCAAERASFALFDVDGSVTVTVRPMRPFRTAAVLPARAGIQPDVKDGCVRFSLAEPRHLTLTLDGDDSAPLHLFVGEPEGQPRRRDDPNILFFGPGLHTLRRLPVRSGQIVYLAGGAVLRAALNPDEKGTFSEKWNVMFYPGAVFDIHNAENVRICGRGILDGSLMPHPACNLIRIADSQDVSVEGIVLRDAPNWNCIIQRSRNVRVDDLRIVSGRLNSDGINSVNSQAVRIRRCFVRNHDDSIVVKTIEPAPPAEDIRVEDCVIWNDWGYALGVTYETRAAVRAVRFHRCDILFARHWCMGIHASDSATVSDVSFSDISVDELAMAHAAKDAYAALTPEPKLLRLAIVRDVWGNDPEPGHIRGVSVENVNVTGERLPTSEILGFNDEHAVENVRIRGVRLRGCSPAADAAALGLRVNAHVRDIRIEP